MDVMFISMFGFPIVVGLRLLSAMFFWLLYYKPVVGCSPAGSAALGALGLGLGGHPKITYAFFRTYTLSWSAFTHSSDPTVFCSISWLSCPLCSAPRLTTYREQLLPNPLLSTISTVVPSFESLKVDIGSGLSHRCQMIYLVLHSFDLWRVLFSFLFSFKLPI